MFGVIALSKVIELSLTGSLFLIGRNSRLSDVMYFSGIKKSIKLEKNTIISYGNTSNIFRIINSVIFFVRYCKMFFYSNEVLHTSGFDAQGSRLTFLNNIFYN